MLLLANSCAGSFSKDYGLNDSTSLLDSLLHPDNMRIRDSLVMSDSVAFSFRLGCIKISTFRAFGILLI